MAFRHADGPVKGVKKKLRECFEREVIRRRLRGKTTPWAAAVSGINMQEEYWECMEEDPFQECEEVFDFGPVQGVAEAMYVQANDEEDVQATEEDVIHDAPVECSAEDSTKIAARKKNAQRMMLSRLERIPFPQRTGVQNDKIE